MTIHKSLQDQYYTTLSLGTSVAQFSLNTSEIMKLGCELMEDRLLPPSKMHLATKMAFSGRLEGGMLFMGVPVRAK